MANQLLTNQELTQYTLMLLSNNTVAIPEMTRDLDQEFGKKGNKIGDTIYVRKPARFVGRDGAAYQAEALTDTQVPITINQQSGVDFQFSTAELYLSLDEIGNRYLEPAAVSIANKLDARALQMAGQNASNVVGTPGVTPGLSSSNAFLIWANAGRKLDEMGFPLKGRKRCAVMNPAARVGWISYNSALFNNQEKIGQQWKTGQVADMIVGLTTYIDQNVYTQTIGALGGTPAVSGAGQTGTTLTVSGCSASVTAWANVGDVFSIAGVYAVNPQTRVSTGSLQQFVIQSQVDTDGSGNATFTFTPAIVPSGQFQNVSNAPANSALINIYDTAAAGQSALAGVNTPQNMIWDKQAFAFVSFPGEVPRGTDKAYSEVDEETGISLRFVRDYVTITDQWTNRFDVYYGMGPLYQEGAVRICG
jgi:hypothetical protein